MFRSKQSARPDDFCIPALSLYKRREEAVYQLPLAPPPEELPPLKELLDELLEPKLLLLLDSDFVFMGMVAMDSRW